MSFLENVTTSRYVDQDLTVCAENCLVVGDLSDDWPSFDEMSKDHVGGDGYETCSNVVGSAFSREELDRPGNDSEDTLALGPIDV